LHGVQEVESSNLSGPTIFPPAWLVGANQIGGPDFRYTCPSSIDAPYP
jgi:hypothetical protein